MIGQSFVIYKYDWKIKIYYNVNKKDVYFCIKELKKLTKQNKYIKECKKTIDTNKKDRAYIYSSYRYKESVVFITDYSSTGELLNTIAHEANHLKSHIATYYNLNEKGEEVCYIIGNIVKYMSKQFIYLICNKI